MLKIIHIKENSKYFNSLIHLELLLWPDNNFEDLFEESKKSNNTFYFGGIIKEKLIGFIQISIRYEYVNGSSTSPLGYIEGIYVLNEYQRCGYGRKLIEFACSFIKEKGYSEIASDVLIDNIESQEFHQKVGFSETERTIYYIRKL